MPRAYGLSGALAGGAVLVLLCAPAGALDLGVDVSIGGSHGVNADAGASLGGSRGLDANASASVGGGGGINADVNASAGGSQGINANARAGVGGNRGIEAGANLDIGGGSGIDAGVNVGIGGGSAGSSDKPRTPNSPGASVTPSMIAGLSDTELLRYRKRCVQVLAQSSSFDSDLVALCRLLRTASR